MNETQATTAFLRELKKHGHFWKSSDRFQAGVPDIVGCWNGHFLGIEMKVDYNCPTPLQIHTMCEIIKNGGYSGVVTYSNKNKMWWLAGESYSKKSDVVRHILGKAGLGGNDIEN